LHGWSFRPLRWTARRLPVRLGGALGQSIWDAARHAGVRRHNRIRRRTSHG
jgi:hypothetical protein